jgi:uncharacterized protein YjbI with pentapeptide repeats
MFSTILISLLALTGNTLASPSARRSATLETRQSRSGTLFGPLTFSGINFSNASITLVNFNDEVFDISSISIFGDINDGGCEESTPESEAAASEQPTRTSVFGPVSMPWSAADVSNAQITLINFNDEVFDISSISVFGDINDGACPAPSA